MAITDFKQDISDVQITLNTLVSDRGNFGDALFVNASPNFSENLVSEYTDLASVQDSFGTNSGAYRAASAFFAQSPKPSKLKITGVDVDIVISLEDVDDNATYSLKFNFGGNITPEDPSTYITISYTAQLGDGASEIIAGLETAISGAPALSGMYSVVNNGLSLRLSGISSDPIAFYNEDEKIDAKYAIASSLDVGQIVTDILAADSGFFFVALDNLFNIENTLEMAQAFTANKKMVFLKDTTVWPTRTNDGQKYDSLGYQINNADFNPNFSGSFTIDGSLCVAVWGSPDNDTYPHVAFLASSSVYPAGTVAWANYPLAGFAIERNPRTGKYLTAEDYTNLAGDNINFVQRQRGLDIIREGKVLRGGKGEWIDTIRGKYALIDDMEAALVDLLASQKGGKLPYTSAGVDIVKAVVSKSLNRFVQKNYLANYKLETVSAANTPTVNKAVRVYNGISFTATLAGAITVVEITGTISN